MDTPKHLEPWRRWTCGLAGWRHRCDRAYDEHHLVNLGKLQKNPKAKRFVETKHPEVFLVTVCHVANVSRLADSKEAQALLLRDKVALFGDEYVRGVYGDLEALFEDGSIKGLDAVLAGLPPDAPPPVV